MKVLYKNILLTLLVSLILVSTISALDFDNKLDYNEQSRTATITNNFGLGGKIADIKLNTPDIVYVIPGKDRKIAEMEFTTTQDYENPFKQMEFYNIKRGMDPIEKNFKYKYRVQTGSRTIPITSSICSDKEVSNKTFTGVTQVCETQIDRYETIPLYEWVDLESSKIQLLPEGNYVIGIFTDVDYDEQGEWIPTFFSNQRITQWAVWNSSLNIGLELYYDFNSTRELVSGVYNLSIAEGAPTFSSSNCKIGTCSQTTINNNLKIDRNPTTDLLPNATDVSLNYWVRITNPDVTGPIFFTRYDGALIRGYVTIGDNSVPNLYYQDVWTGTTRLYGENYPTSTYMMLTYTKNSSGWGKIYVNGTMQWQGQSTFASWNGDYDIYLGSSSVVTDAAGQYDEMGWWSRILSDSEVDQLYNNFTGIAFQSGASASGITVTLTNPSNQTTSTNSSFNFTASASAAGGYNFTNATIKIYNSNNSMFYTNTIALSSNGLIDVNWSRSGFFGDNYRWNVEACGSNVTNINCTTALNGNFTLIVGAEEVYTIFNPSTVQGASENFFSNVILQSGSTFTANLVWNNTYYPATVNTISSNNYTLSRTITIPSVTGNKTWFWQLLFSSGTNQNLSNHFQQVNQISITNCTTGNLIGNFSLYDEDTRTPINGTIELDLTVYNIDRSGVIGTMNRSYSITVPNTAQVCFSDLNATYSLDYQAKYYSNESYSVEYKFGQNVTISNSTGVQNIKLYDLLSSRTSKFTITVQGPDLSLIEGVVVDVQRQYVPLGQYLSVESPVTDDTGKTIANLVQNEIYYNFVITKNGQPIASFIQNLVQCQNPVTLDCRITLNLAQATSNLPDFENYGNISTNYLFDKDTRILLFNFVATDSNTHNVSLVVTQLNNYGNTTICSTSSIASIGTYTCNVLPTYGNYSILTQSYSDGLYLGQSSFSFGASSENIFGGTRVILGILMYTTLTFLFIGNPILMVIGSILGLIFAALFFLVDGGSFLGNSFIILWAIVSGAIIISYMKNRV